jgi:hypothetical protein
MEKLIHMPDVMLEVIAHVDIQTVLALRLTCSSVRFLIDKYQGSIARHAARATFGHSAEKHIHVREGEKEGIAWLVKLVPRLLAAVLVENIGLAAQSSAFQALADETPFGNYLRERLERGLCILEAFSRIAKEVNQSFQSTNVRESESSSSQKSLKGTFKRLLPGDETLRSIKKREKEILRRRILFAERLDESHISDYLRLRDWLGFPLLCVSCDWPPLACNVPRWKRKWTFQEKGKKVLVWDKVRIKQWMDWYILEHGGTELWEHKWTETDTCNGCVWWKPEHHRFCPTRKAVVECYEGRNKEQLEIEFKASAELANYLRMRDTAAILP